MAATKEYKEVGKGKIDKIVKSGRFEVPQIEQTYDHRRFFIFRWPGDSIEGILGLKITNIKRNASYPIKLDNGEIVEFFGNKLLHSIIADNELIGSGVKIVYIGYQHLPGGGLRARKIYRVFKIFPRGRDDVQEMYPKSKKAR